MTCPFSSRLKVDFNTACCETARPEYRPGSDLRKLHSRAPGYNGNFTYLITGLRHSGSLKNRVEELDNELLLFAG